jgi:hypothetical protein
MIVFSDRQLSYIFGQNNQLIHMKFPGLRIILIIHCFSLSAFTFAQKFYQGNYSDFDNGPHGVYGAHPLDNTNHKEYWQLSRIDNYTARSIKFNAAGVLTTTVIITFKNGLLSHQEEINQWGDTIRYKTFLPLGKDYLQVTDVVKGTNRFLPGKYAIDIYKNELLEEESFHSNSGRLKDNWRGFSTVRYQRYDDKNRFSKPKESAFYNSKNAPVIANGVGYFRIVNGYDSNGNIISEAFFDTQNRPMAIRSGNVSSCKYFYNDQEELIRDEYFGLNEHRTLSENGISSIEHVYDKGLEVKEIRRDSLDHINRSDATGDGIAIIKTEYDDRGNKTRESYYDENEQPINSQAGFHGLSKKYSLDNMLLETSYFDIYDQAGMDRDSVHAVHYTRSRIGRIIEEYSTDLTGKKIKNYADEVYMVRTNYNPLGQVESYTYWKDTVTPMPRWNGVYKTSFKYDEDGSITEYNFYDQNGALFKTADGSSTVQVSFQDDGRVVKREFLFNGSLITRTRGVSSNYSVIRYEYDSAGRPSELRFYGSNHEAVDATIEVNEKLTAHRVVFIWKYARIIEQWYYKMNDTDPFLKLDCLKNDYLSTTGINTGRKNSN